MWCINEEKIEKMTKNNSKEINFQHYVEAVKSQEMTWNIFIELIEDLSYSDIKRLKIFNAILLMELTMDYSDLDRLKYLNVILLNQFKKSIQKKNSKIENIDENHDSTIEVDNAEVEESSKDFISKDSKIRRYSKIPKISLEKFQKSQRIKNS